MVGVNSSELLRIDASRPPLLRATLTDADGGNWLDETVAVALTDVLDQAEADPLMRLLVLEAEGPFFCSGTRLHGSGQLLADRVALIGALVQRLHESRLVTVAVVNGVASGGGVGLAAACDQVVAGPEASFRLTELLLGLVPAVIWPVLVERVGLQRAYSLALLSDRIPADKAEQIGLADIRSAETAATVSHLVRRVRAAEPAAVVALKTLRRRSAAGPAASPGSGIPDVLTELLHGSAFGERRDSLQRGGLIR